MRRTVVVLLGLSVSWSALAADYIVIATAGRSSTAATAVVSAGGTVNTTLSGIDTLLVSSDSTSFLTDVSKSSSVRAATLDADVAAVQPADVVPFSIATDGSGAAAADDDDYSFLQWSLDAVDARGAWDAGYTGAGVRICVIDEGVQSDNPDLAENFNAALSTSFVPGETYDAEDPDGDGFNHGTHVAGIAAAADNDWGIVGVAPGAEIVSIKALSEELGYGEFSWVIQAILYAGDIECDVVNMSLGGVTPRHEKGYTSDISEVLNAVKSAIAYAESQGATVVVAAGNQSIDADHTGSLNMVPAGMPKTLTISATGPTGWAVDDSSDLDEPAFYTNYGSSLIDHAAPGGNVDFDLYFEFWDSSGQDGWCDVGGLIAPCFAFDLVLSDSPGGLTWAAGTSMAAPHTAGVAALAYEALGSKATPAKVKSLIQAGAADLGKSGHDDWYGQGRVDAAATVE